MKWWIKYSNNQIEVNDKDVDKNPQVIRDVTGRQSVKTERNIDILNSFITKQKKTTEVPDIQEYMFKEEELDNNPSI